MPRVQDSDHSISDNDSNLFVSDNDREPEDNQRDGNEGDDDDDHGGSAQDDDGGLFSDQVLKEKLNKVLDDDGHQQLDTAVELVLAKNAYQPNGEKSVREFVLYHVMTTGENPFNVTPTKHGIINYMEFVALCIIPAGRRVAIAESTLMARVNWALKFCQRTYDDFVPPSKHELRAKRKELVSDGNILRGRVNQRGYLDMYTVEHIIVCSLYNDMYYGTLRPDVPVYGRFMLLLYWATAARPGDLAVSKGYRTEGGFVALTYKHITLKIDPKKWDWRSNADPLPEHLIATINIKHAKGHKYDNKNDERIVRALPSQPHLCLIANMAVHCLRIGQFYGTNMTDVLKRAAKHPSLEVEFVNPELPVLIAQNKRKELNLSRPASTAVVTYGFKKLLEEADVSVPGRATLYLTRRGAARSAAINLSEAARAGVQAPNQFSEGVLHHSNKSRARPTTRRYTGQAQIDFHAVSVASRAQDVFNPIKPPAKRAYEQDSDAPANLKHQKTHNGEKVPEVGADQEQQDSEEMSGSDSGSGSGSDSDSDSEDEGEDEDDELYEQRLEAALKPLREERQDSCSIMTHELKSSLGLNSYSGFIEKYSQTNVYRNAELHKIKDEALLAAAKERKCVQGGSRAPPTIFTVKCPTEGCPVSHYERNERITAHIAKCNAPKRFKCEICDQRFSKWDDQIVHMRNNHQKVEDYELLGCPIDPTKCEEKLKYERMLNHIVRHVGLPCTYGKNCKTSYAQANSLCYHLRNSHNLQQNEASKIANAATLKIKNEWRPKLQKKLREQKDAELGVKPDKPKGEVEIPCSQCNEMVKYKDYPLHMEKHDGGWVCPECPETKVKRLGSIQGLKYHIIKEHKVAKGSKKLDDLIQKSRDKCNHNESKHKEDREAKIAAVSKHFAKKEKGLQLPRRPADDGARKFRCPLYKECKDPTLRTRQLFIDSHMYAHDKLHCPVCTQAYSSKYTVLQHVKSRGRGGHRITESNRRYKGLVDAIDTEIMHIKQRWEELIGDLERNT